MDELMKRGGKAKTMKQKQKQSVVIKNVINIGERKKKMNKRQKRARKQPPQQSQPFIPMAIQQSYPSQRLFQPQQQIYRGVVMTSADANEAGNNVSAPVDASQKISDGKVKAEVNNQLSNNPFSRLLTGLENPFIKKKLDFGDLKTPAPEPKKERKVRSDYGKKRKRILPPYSQPLEEKILDEDMLEVIDEKKSNDTSDKVKQKANELVDIINTSGERNQQYLNEKILEAKNKKFGSSSRALQDDEDM